MQFTIITLTTFVLMEAVAYFAHRYLFHGPLWFLHRSHHEPRKGGFEWNDLFGLFFAPIAIVLMSELIAPAYRDFAFAVGSGMTLYGCVYFFIHDMYTHRRFWNIDFKSRWFREMRSAHRHHHANVLKEGQEPFGFLVFPSVEKLREDQKRSRTEKLNTTA